ncbi:MAG: hypothetical protein WCS25_09790 [Victivallaceae bacterium]
MKYHFTTYFDSIYVLQGITLYRSLKITGVDFTLYVACLDQRAYDIISKLDEPDIIPIRLDEIEKFDPEFAAVKSNRSIVEYYFTLSPVLPLYIFNKFSGIDILAYLDSDLYFYSSPQPVYDEFDGKSVLIIEHRFPDELRWREKFGKYNVQCQLYRNDEDALNCLHWWRKRCIEWCYDRLESGRFADQKYLDCWPQKFRNVIVLQHKGAGLAPWNWYAYDLKIHDSITLTVDGEPLIFYHFQGFKPLNRFMLNHGLGSYHRVMPQHLLRWFYSRYFKELKKTRQQLVIKAGAEDISLYGKNRRTGFGKLRMIASAVKNRGLMLNSGS